MLGKLLKYDFRSMFKQFALIWPAALLLALVNGFLLRANLDESSQPGSIVTVILTFAYTAILMGMFITAVIFVVRRFYAGLLGDEGYLMHTLPVQPWQLIGSKLLTAIAVTVLSTLVAVLSILLIIPADWSQLPILFRGFMDAFHNVSQHIPSLLLYLLELVLLLLAAMAAGFLHLYLAMAIGHLFSKNRGLLSAVAYIGISLFWDMVLGLMGLTEFSIELPALGAEAVSHLALWVLIIGNLLLSAIYFFCTDLILRKRLNLE